MPLPFHQSLQVFAMLPLQLLYQNQAKKLQVFALIFIFHKTSVDSLEHSLDFIFQGFVFHGSCHISWYCKKYEC